MDSAAALEGLTSRLTEYRGVRNLSLQGMATAAGVSIGTVRRIERGENISVATLVRIAEHLDVSVGYLLGDEANSTPRVLDPLLPYANALTVVDVATLVTVAKRLTEAAPATASTGLDLDDVDQDARDSIARNIREQQADGSRRRAAEQRDGRRPTKDDDDSDQRRPGRSAG